MQDADPAEEALVSDVETISEAAENEEGRIASRDHRYIACDVGMNV